MTDNQSESVFVQHGPRSPYVHVLRFEMRVAQRLIDGTRPEILVPSRAAEINRHLAVASALWLMVNPIDGLAIALPTVSVISLGDVSFRHALISTLAGLEAALDAVLPQPLPEPKDTTSITYIPPEDPGTLIRGQFAGGIWVWDQEKADGMQAFNVLLIDPAAPRAHVLKGREKLKDGGYEVHVAGFDPKVKRHWQNGAHDEDVTIVPTASA